MLLEGMFLPLTTPFHPDGRLFLRKLQTNVARYSLTSAAGMLVLGQEGEGESLTDQESREVLETAIAAAGDDKVMLANVGRASVAATLQMLETASAAGYDAVTICPPRLLAAPSLGLELVTYFQTIADRAATPIVLVSHRERPISTSVMAQLAQHPNVLGSIHHETPDGLNKLIERTSDVQREVNVTTIFAAVTGRMRRHAKPAENFVSAASLGGTATLAAPPATILKTRTKRVGFQLLSGTPDTLLDDWNVGGCGGVLRFAACAPQACCEVWQAFKDGDPPLAAEKQNRIQAASHLLDGARGIAALKYGCDLNAYFGGRPRLPLLPLEASAREAMERALAGIKN
jgi:4-hydroxy-2-oxoglutarate aldolase